MTYCDNDNTAGDSNYSTCESEGSTLNLMIHFMNLMTIIVTLLTLPVIFI